MDAVEVMQNNAIKTIDSTPKSKEELLIEKSLFAKVALYAKKTSAGLGLKPVRTVILNKLLKMVGVEEFRKLIRRQIDHAMSEATVCYGVEETQIGDAIEALIKTIEQGSSDTIARKIAQGDLPEPGKSTYIQYVLNPNNKPMGQSEGVPPTSDKVWFHVVHKGDVLVELIPAAEGKPGRSVLGEKIEAPACSGKPVHLTSIVGDNTLIEGNKLIATIEGAYEENAVGRVRVVPEIVIQNVDALSGSLPAAGSSLASMMVCQDVKGPYGVSSTENDFVGIGKNVGLVEKTAFISAKNLVVHGTLQGIQEDGQNCVAVEVEELCVAQDIDGRLVRAGSLMVAGDCRRVRLEIDEWAHVNGDVVGCLVICRQEFTAAGNLGSAEGGSHTRIVIPLDRGASRKIHRIDAEIAKKKKELSVFQEKTQQLQAENAKRAKTDMFWAGLLNGETRPPKTAMEGQTQRQFHAMVNQQKKLAKITQELVLSLRLLQEKRKDCPDGDNTSQGIVVRVGGQFFLDAAVEATCCVAEADMDVKVTYSIDGKKFRNHTLRDVLQYLNRQASDYIHSREENVATRREAIDKMFEGREVRPTGPKMVHKSFELDFVWADEEAQAESPLKVQVTGQIHTLEPRKLKIVAVAALREMATGVELLIASEGPRAKFAIGAFGAKIAKWHHNPERMSLLDNISIRGLSARGVMAGEDVPEEISNGVLDMPVETSSEPVTNTP